jgi:tetratricopeptide (TPR) repeat protein
VQRKIPLDLLGIALLIGACAAAYFGRPMRTPAPAAKIVEADDDLAQQPMHLEVDAGAAAGAKLNREGVELARTGNLEDATSKLRQALREAPGNKNVQRNLQQVLTAWGMQELRWGQPRVAADRFIEALSFGRRAPILTGLGAAHVKGGQYSEAIAALEESIRLDGKNAATYLALSQAYEDSNDRTRALQTLRHARDSGAADGAILARLRYLDRDAHVESNFSETSSGHFQVSFDAGENRDAAAEVLRSLESAYREVGNILGYFPERPTPVVLYAEQDFHRVTRTPDWAGAVYDGRLKFPVRGLSAGADLDRVARHEYAHSLIAALSANRAPAWLNEGLAMWVEDGGRGDDRGQAEEVMHRRAGHAYPLQILSGSFASMSAQQAQVAYAQSYLAVLYLAQRYDRSRIGPFLEALRRHGSVDDAFAEVYPVTFARFESELRGALR